MTAAVRIPPPDFMTDPALVAVLDAVQLLRVVGGAVRDTLAGRAVTDIDLATPVPPSDVMAALTQAGLKAVPTGLAHGTVTAMSGGRGYEITTLRRDVQTDGRHAVVDFTDDWRADAARRDFTINALSMTRDGGVHDYFGGLDDLRAGRVRFVGDPATRIAEDHLRILRFFRFQARYGAGPPDAAAAAAIAAGADGVARLSAERIWSELKRILAAPSPGESFASMRDLGVIGRVLPEGADIGRLSGLPQAAPADPLLRLAALLVGDPAALAQRLHLSGREAERLDQLRRPALSPADDDNELRRALADTARDILIDRVWLAGGDTGLIARLTAMPQPVFDVQGRDLLACGVPAGAALGAALRELRAWWLRGGCAAGRGACLAELRARLAAG